MTLKKHAPIDLLIYAVQAYNRTHVNDGPDALLQDVPRASLAHSKATSRHPGVSFKLCDAQGRLLADGRVDIDRAGRRWLRFLNSAGTITALIRQAHSYAARRLN
jgi:hypothetical protein